MAEIERVVDGDTLDLKIDLGFGIWIRRRCRLAGVDTPETRTRDAVEKKYGKMAMARVSEVMQVGEVYKVKVVEASGKYGRILADMYVNSRMRLTTLLIREHLAVEYHGQNRKLIQKEHKKNFAILEKQA